MSRIVVGLDIGSCFIRVVIGEVDDNGKLEIIGFAKRPSKGLRNGVIVNLDEATAVIQETIEVAEQSAGVMVESVFTVVGGSQTESMNSRGPVAVDPTGRNRRIEVNENAKQRAIQNAQSIVIPIGKKLLHTIPQEYIIDNAYGYKNPIGNLGVRLEVAVHLVIASETVIENIKQVLLRAGYAFNGATLKSLAAAFATVHEDEMELGSVLIDLGGDSTDVIVFNKGSPVFTASIPYGGNIVTSDIACVLGIPVSFAEKIKVENGCCWTDSEGLEEKIVISGIGGKSPQLVPKKIIAQIMQARLAEILKLVREKIASCAELRNADLSGSVVLTGGGALTQGIVELTQAVWKTSSVRLGCTPSLGFLSDTSYRDADFATATGLVLVNKDNDLREHSRHRKGSQSFGKKSGVVEKIKNVFGKFF